MNTTLHLCCNRDYALKGVGPSWFIGRNREYGPAICSPQLSRYSTYRTFGTLLAVSPQRQDQPYFCSPSIRMRGAPSLLRTKVEVQRKLKLTDLPTPVLQALIADLTPDLPADHHYRAGPSNLKQWRWGISIVGKILDLFMPL